MSINQPFNIISYFRAEPECKKMNSGSGYQSPNSNMPPAMQAVQQVSENKNYKRSIDQLIIINSNNNPNSHSSIIILNY